MHLHIKICQVQRVAGVIEANYVTVCIIYEYHFNHVSVKSENIHFPKNTSNINEYALHVDLNQESKYDFCHISLLASRHICVNFK